MESLSLEVANESGEVTTGTYDVVSTPRGSGAQGPLARAQLVATTATCGPRLDLDATGGTITLTQVGATGVTGSFSVDFGAQGTLTGSFNLPICTPPDASTSGAVCQP